VHKLHVEKTHIIFLNWSKGGGVKNDTFLQLFRDFMRFYGVDSPKNVSGHRYFLQYPPQQGILPAVAKTS